MPATPIARIFRRIEGTAVPEASDTHLLQRFLAQSDGDAFTALVRRHGPMVLGVCRRLVRQEQDAEDAFQATFLVLARKAATIRRHDTLGSWLHGVAFRVANRVRTQAQRRRHHEKQAAAQRPSVQGFEDAWRELQTVLDFELGQLSTPYKTSLILCCLEGLTHEEAARRLGWPLGTVKTRVARARVLLRDRLAKRGLTLPATTLGIVLAANSPVGALPMPLLQEACCAAVGTGGASARVTAMAGAFLGSGSPIVSRLLLGFTTLLVLVGIGWVSGPQGLPPTNLPIGPENPQATLREEPAVATSDPLPEGAVARLGSLRFNHGDGLRALHFTPDGHRVLSWGGGHLRIWDSVTGKELRHTEGAPKSNLDITAQSPDGKTLILLDQAFAGDLLQVYNIADLKIERETRLPERRGEMSIYRNNALSADGSLAVIHTPERIHVFDVAKASALVRLPLTARDVHSVVFAGLDRVVTADKDQKIAVWDARTGQPRQQFLHGCPVHILAASPDGRSLATLEHNEDDYDRSAPADKIHLWDLKEGKEIRVLQSRPKRWFRTLCFSPNGRVLLSYSRGRDGSELTAWDVGSGERLWENTNGEGHILAFRPDGKQVLCSGFKGTFSLLDANTGRHIFDPEARHAWASDVWLSPQGDRVSTMGYSSISTWDVATGRRTTVDFQQSWYTDPHRVFSPDGRLAMAFLEQAGKSEAMIWDLHLGKIVRKLPVQADSKPYTSAFSPRGDLLATWHASREPRIHIWDINNGKLIRSFPTPIAWPGHLFITDEGKRLTVVGSRTASYEVATGNELFQWRLEPIPDTSGLKIEVVGGGGGKQPERSPWRRCVLSPTGMWTAGVLDSGLGRQVVPERLVLCDATTGKILHRWKDSGKPTNGFEEIAFSPDGLFLATTDFGNVIHLWETATAQKVRTFHGHRGEIRSLSWSSDGRRLASSSTDATLLIWDVVPQLPKKPGDREALWTNLGHADVSRAYVALWHLVQGKGTTVDLLNRHLKPAPAPNPQQLQQWISDLDSDTFVTRTRATQALESLGETALPALREALKSATSLELRRRLEQILAREPELKISPQLVHELRALAVLERIGTPEARALIERLAAGAPGARLTRQAQSAIRRIKE